VTELARTRNVLEEMKCGVPHFVRVPTMKATLTMAYYATTYALTIPHPEVQTGDQPSTAARQF
jgi:hypothetical protein